MKNVEIVIGANYGDEGKGLMTRYFATQEKNSIVVFHNGSAQRGHTIDYDDGLRHVYHHFGSATGDGVPTYFAETFLIHPQEYEREYHELVDKGIFPKTYCHRFARIITPFDMLVDHITENYIAEKTNKREYGSCGYGTWCATDRLRINYNSIYSVNDYNLVTDYTPLLEETAKDCLSILGYRNVPLKRIPKKYKEYFLKKEKRDLIIKRFIKTLNLFFSHTMIVSDFNGIYRKFSNIVFENGQGLGLDQNVDNEWHTTSNTGILNPYTMLKDKDDFSAKVCYVSRTYETRHGDGPILQEVNKEIINPKIFDKTNIFNDFQGGLRFGILNLAEQDKRIDKDFSILNGDERFIKEKAFTHVNELEIINMQANYMSDNPYEVVRVI